MGDEIEDDVCVICLESTTILEPGDSAFTCGQNTCPAKYHKNKCLKAWWATVHAANNHGGGYKCINCGHKHYESDELFGYDPNVNSYRRDRVGNRVDPSFVFIPFILIGLFIVLAELYKPNTGGAGTEANKTISNILEQLNVNKTYSPEKKAEEFVKEIENVVRNRYKEKINEKTVISAQPTVFNGGNRKTRKSKITKRKTRK